MKKIVSLMLVVVCLIVLSGCGNTKDEKKDSNSNKEEIADKKEESTNKKEEKEPKNYTQMICEGKPRSKYNSYKNYKDIKVKWVVSFNDKKKITDISGSYVMYFEDDTKSSVLDENKKQLQKDFCDYNKKGRTFSDCNVKTDDNTIKMNATFNLKSIDSSELRAVEDDHDMINSLLAVNLDGLDDYTCTLK